MGSMVPVIMEAVQVAKTVGSIASVVGQGASILGVGRDDGSRLALQHLQQKQNINNANVIEKDRLERLKIRASANEKESQRRLALKRAVSRQRAKFGGSGISSNGGSSEAVLLGLFEESEGQRNTRNTLDNIRLKALDQNLNNITRVNTLARTQLREKEKLKNSKSTFETTTDLLSIIG